MSSYQLKKIKNDINQTVQARLNAAAAELKRKMAMPVSPRTSAKRGNKVMVTTGTQTTSKKSRTRVVSRNSKSAGRFGKTSKRYKNKYAKFAKLGCTRTTEYGGITNGSNIVFIGHSTVARNPMLFSLASAIIKKFLIKIGKMPKDQTDNVFGLVPGSVFIISYKDDPDSDAIATTTLATGVVTFTALVQALESVLLVPGDSQRALISIEYNDGNGANAEIMHLKNAKVVLAVKSSFKVQNRTLDSNEGDSTDVVDNSPLYGKSYYGNGSGTLYTGNVGTTGEIIADRLHGTIDVVPSTINSLQEPPIGRLFPQVKGQGKAHLDPGHIKTSVLTDYKTILVSSLMRSLNSTASTTAFRPLYSFGKFKFFGFEKMLNPTLSSPQISTAWEHNYFIGMYLIAGYETYTTSSFQQLYKP